MVHALSSRHSYVSRSTGRSAVAAWGYISAAKVVDPITQKSFNYQNKNHVAFTHVVVPDHAPDWMKRASAETIFKAAELYEGVWADRRFYKNKEYAEAHKSKATTARTAHFTLPNEFDLNTAQEIADKFVRERFVQYGVAAAYAIHNDPGNLHFHVIATQRVIKNDLEGFGVKATPFKNAATMSVWARENRQYLTDLSNEKLRELGIDKLVECRSFEELGIELEPQQHEGILTQNLHKDLREKLNSSVDEVVSQAEQENAEIKERNQQKILENPELILSKINSTQATFTERDIASECFKVVDGDDKLYAFLMNKLMANDKLVSLRQDYWGRLRYTTKDYLQQEHNMFFAAEKLHNQQTFKVDKKQFLNRLEHEELKLNAEQKQAALSIIGECNLALISGVAGSGKTTMLRPAAMALQEAGYNVIGLSLAGTAAANLQREVGIKSETIHRFLLRDITLNKKDILLIDEAGMVGTSQMEKLLNKAASSGAAVRLIGDDYQLSAIAAGDAFRGLRERFGDVRVSTVVRQQQVWERENVRLMSEHKIADALITLEQNGRMKWYANRAELINNVVDTYVKLRAEHNVIISSFERKDVAELNLKVRTRLVELGDLEQGIRINEKFWSRNDQIMFLSNDTKQEFVKIKDNSSGIMNGNIGVIQEVSKNKITVLLSDKRIANFNPEQYHDFTYAYAATGHKLQGSTVDVVLNMISKYDRANSLYVNLSRGKHENYVFVNKEICKDIRALESLVSRSEYKDLVSDWQFSNQKERDAYALVGSYLKVCKASANQYRVLNSVEKIDYQSAEWQAFKQLTNERKELASSIISNWSEHNLFIKQAGLRHHEVMIHAGQRERTKTDSELQAEAIIKQYRDATLQARESWNDICKTHVGGKAREHKDFIRFEVLREKRDGLASEVLSKIDLCRNILSYQERKIIKQRAQEHEVRVEQKQYLASLTHEQFTSYSLVKDFVDQVRINYSTQQKLSKTKKYSSLDWLHYSSDKQASELCKKLDQYFSYLQRCGMNYSTVMFMARRYAIRDLAQDFNRNIHKEHNAKELLQLIEVDRPGVHQALIKQSKLNMDEVKEWALFAGMKDHDGHKSAQLVQQYRAAIRNAAKLKHSPDPRAHLQAVYERNLIATKVNEKIDSCQKWLNLTGIGMDKVLYHTEQHERHQKNKEGQSLASLIRQYKSFSRDANKTWAQAIKEAKESNISAFDTKAGAVWKQHQNQRNYVAHLINQHEQDKTDKLLNLAQVKRETLTKHGEQFEFSNKSRTYIDYKNVYEDLSRNIDKIALTLLHSTTKSNRNGILRIGNKGALAVNTINGTWYDHSKGVGGGPLDMVMYYQRCDKKAALQWCDSNILGFKISYHSKEITNEVTSQIPILPEKIPQKNPQTTEEKLIFCGQNIGQTPINNAQAIAEDKYLNYMLNKNEIKAQYSYCDEHGKVKWYVFRLEGEQGKITPPLTYWRWRDSPEQGVWRWKGVPSDINRSIYGLEKLSMHPDKPVLIVEGEKTTDAAQKLLPEYNVVSWMGGAAAYGKTDWSSLKDKQVTIWPDNDIIGHKAAKEIQGILKEQHNTSALVVTVPKSFPEKWDLADKIPQGFDLADIKCLLSGPDKNLEKAGYNQAVIYLNSLVKGNELAASCLLERIYNLRLSGREVAEHELNGMANSLVKIEQRVQELNQAEKEQLIKAQPTLTEITHLQQKHEHLALIEARYIADFYRYNFHEPDTKELRLIQQRSFIEHQNINKRAQEIYSNLANSKDNHAEKQLSLIALRAAECETRTGRTFTEAQLPAIEARVNYEITRQNLFPELNPYQIKCEADQIEQYWHYHGSTPKQHHLDRFQAIANAKTHETSQKLTQYHKDITYDPEAQGKNYEQLCQNFIQQNSDDLKDKHNTQANLIAIYILEAKSNKGRELTCQETEAIKLYVNHYLNCVQDSFAKLHTQQNNGNKLETHLKIELSAHVEARKLIDYANKQDLPDYDQMKQIKLQASEEIKTITAQQENYVHRLQHEYQHQSKEALYISHYMCTFEQTHGIPPTAEQIQAMAQGAKEAVNCEAKIEQICQEIYSDSKMQYSSADISYNARYLSYVQGRMHASHYITTSEQLSEKLHAAFERNSVRQYNAANLFKAEFPQEKQNTQVRQTQKEI